MGQLTTLPVRLYCPTTTKWIQQIESGFVYCNLGLLIEGGHHPHAQDEVGPEDMQDFKGNNQAPHEQARVLEHFSESNYYYISKGLSSAIFTL